MGKRQIAVTQINLVATHYDETLRFYRLLGLEVPDPFAQPPGALHAPANAGGGAQFEIDDEFLARIYNAAWRKPGGSSSLLLGVEVETPQEVDAIFSKLVSAGYESRQSPYDALWGSRFAIIADPEGNDVGLMSPPDENFKSWPPVDSPAP